MPEPYRGAVFATPFPSLIYGPIKMYLGQMNSGEFARMLLTQAAWIAALAVLLAVLWRRGVRSYDRGLAR